MNNLKENTRKEKRDRESKKFFSISSSRALRLLYVAFGSSSWIFTFVTDVFSSQGTRKSAPRASFSNHRSFLSLAQVNFRLSTGHTDRLPAQKYRYVVFFSLTCEQQKLTVFLVNSVAMSSVIADAES